jgi:hypothetical protein
MSMRHPLRMPGVLSYGIGHFPSTACMVRGTFVLASLTAATLIKTPSASAVPSYARQTGQPCSTCHTAFPELTPFGRQFKLMGYTSGGTPNASRLVTISESTCMRSAQQSRAIAPPVFSRLA